MTNTYNTRNALGSTDPRDLLDNASNLDDGMNSALPTFTDRLGVSRDTWAGMQNTFDTSQTGRENAFTLSQADKESRFQAFLVSSGYVSKGDYAAGVVLAERNEYVAVNAATTGTSPGLYRPNASATLPLTLTGTWATDSANLVLLGDDVLRQELAGSNGAAMIGRGVVAVESVAELLALPTEQRQTDLRYLVKGYYAGSDVGGGEFYFDPARIAENDDGLVLDGFVRVLNGPVMLSMFGVTDSASDQTARINQAISSVSEGGGGVIVSDLTVLHVAASSADGIAIRMRDRVILDLMETEVLLTPNALTNYEIISMRSDIKTYAKVFGGKIVGDRNGHTGTTGEWGMGISIHGPVRAEIVGTKVYDCWGDGVYIGADLSNGGRVRTGYVFMDLVEGHNNRRNGCSIVEATRVVIPRCEFSGTNGTAPGAGIDIEPNQNGAVYSVELGKVRTTDNAGEGVLIIAPHQPAIISEVSIDSLKSDRNGGGGISASGYGRLAINSITAEGNLKGAALFSGEYTQCGSVYGANNDWFTTFTGSFGLSGSGHIGQIRLVNEAVGAAPFVNIENGLSVEVGTISVKDGSSSNAFGVRLSVPPSSRTKVGDIVMSGLPAGGVTVMPGGDAGAFRSVKLGGVTGYDMNKGTVANASVLTNSVNNAVLCGVTYNGGPVKPANLINNSGNFVIVADSVIRSVYASGTAFVNTGSNVNTATLVQIAS